MFGVRGIPTFIILDKEGNAKDAAARGKVESSDPPAKVVNDWRA